MNDIVKRSELASGNLDALDRTRVDRVVVSSSAGGVSFISMLEVMEFAKLMATSMQAIPAVFRGNPGMCLGIVTQAIEWRMSPYAVINKAYVVNDRIGFESQLLHGVIEARAPLQKRLRCTYAGEGPTRACTVIGLFSGEDEPHEYTSPMLKDIKVKNSPLWTGDPDQQLFYFASRAWARKWAPDVILGVYTKEEIEAIEEDAPRNNGVRARIAAADKGREGHNPDKVARDLANIASNTADSGAPVIPAASDTEVKQVAAGRRARRRGKSRATMDVEKAIDDARAAGTDEYTAGIQAKTNEAAQQAEPFETEHLETSTVTLTDPAKMPSQTVASRVADRAAARSAPEQAKAVPTTPAEYVVYAEKWIDDAPDEAEASRRWDREKTMRDDLGVPVVTRNKLSQRISNRFPGFD